MGYSWDSNVGGEDEDSLLASTVGPLLFHYERKRWVLGWVVQRGRATWWGLFLRIYCCLSKVRVISGVWERRKICLKGDGRDARRVGSRTRGPLNATPINKLVTGFTVPTVVDVLIDTVCGVISRVFVKRNMNVLKGTTAGITFPIAAVTATLTLLLKVNNTSGCGLRVKTKRRGGTDKVTKATLSSLMVDNLVLTMVTLIFLGPLLALFKTAASIVPCTISCAKVATLKLPFCVLSINKGRIIETSEDPACSVAYVVVKTVVGAVLSPIFVFMFK